MIIQVEKNGLDESEWDCENWGIEEDGSTVYASDKCFVKKKSKTRREEKKKKKKKAIREEEEKTKEEQISDKEEGEAIDHTDEDEYEILEKFIVYRPPYRYHSVTVKYGLDGSRLSLDQYNNHEGTKYYFSNLVEVIYHDVIYNGAHIDKHWSIYCIKFKASPKLVPTDENDMETFHSKILFGKSRELVLHIQKSSRDDIEFDFEDNIVVHAPTEKALPRINFCSILAIHDFNNNNKDTKYCFLSLVKASAYLVCGTDWCIYDILFKAYQADNAANPETFQAKVFDRSGVTSFVMASGVTSFVMAVGILPAAETSAPNLYVPTPVERPIHPIISQWMLPH